MSVNTGEINVKREAMVNFYMRTHTPKAKVCKLKLLTYHMKTHQAAEKPYVSEVYH